MNSDLVINISVYNQTHGTSFVSTYSLSSYTPNETETTFQQLKRDIIAKNKDFSINWMSASLVVNNFSVATIKGNMTWFNNLEFFRKFVNSGSSFKVDTPDGFGVIDQERKIRIEFENGQIMITPL